MRRKTIDWTALREQLGDRCFICQFVAGNSDFRHHIVYEDERHIAFLNKYPTVYGYVLVAPKEHRERVVDDFTASEYLAMHAVIRRVGMAIERVVPCERLYILSLGSQQANKHVHWHLAPLPPGIPLDAQQFHALSGDQVLDLDDSELRSLAHEIGRAVRA